MAIQFLRGKTTEINQATTINLQPGQPLLDTTKGCLYINADPDDTAKKVSNPSAFTKFPSLKGTTKGFVKYDGTNYTTTADVVESIGGASGTIQLGSGLTLKNGTLSATNASSTSINGLTGEVTISGGDGVEVIKSESDRTITVSAAKVKSVTGISNEYQATNVENNLISTGWVPNASEAGFSATKKYLYVKQTTTYSDHTSDAKTFINSVWGADGKDGTSVTILSPKYDSLEEFNSATDKKEEPGAAYLVAGDLWVWTLGQSGNPGSWQNVGRIQGPQGPKGDKGDAGATGTGATITFKYLASTSKLPSAESSDWDDDLQFARGKLSEYKPILWCQEIVNDASGTSTPKIYILEILPYKTYTRYADIGAFDTNTFQPIGTPSIYDSPKSTTGWMGIYSGYAQTAPANYEKYKWAYYLTEINRTNFMTNVIDNANYIDGIYTKEGSGGKKYIGINASAINTGSLKVTDGTDILFDANITEKKVGIAGWKVSKDQISKNGVGLYSGSDLKAPSLIKSSSNSPIRFFSAPEPFEVKTMFFGYPPGSQADGFANYLRVDIDDSTTYYIAEATDEYYKLKFNKNIGILNESGVWDAPLGVNALRLNEKDGGPILYKAGELGKIKAAGQQWYLAVESAGQSLLYISKNALDSISLAKVKILEDGSLYASAASIEGNINAISGKIGNCTISADGAIKSANGKFIVSSEGNVNATSGKIGSFEIVPIDNNNDYYKLIGINTLVNNKYTTEIYPWGYDSSITLLEQDIVKNTTIKQTKISLNNISILGADSDSNIQNSISLSSTAALSASTTEPLWPALYGYPRLIIGINSVGSNNPPSAPYLTLDSSSGNLQGTWYKGTSEITTSSRNKKHDVEELDNRYSTLLDNLKPVRFKYNDGVSNRYHTGLILDEMKDAMDTAQIDSSEFAAYCVQDKETGDGGIRYEELIALLIKEVQELKRKIR